jgi:hypothetical protein
MIPTTPHNEECPDMSSLTVEEKAAFGDAILWRQGSGSITFGCNDEGLLTMQVEHAEAQDEFFMADSPEALARLVLKADKETA